MNIYNYVSGNPLKYNDPFGLVISDNDNLVSQLLSSEHGKDIEVFKLLDQLQQSKTLVSVADADIQNDPGYINYGNARREGCYISVNVDMKKHKSSQDATNTLLHELLHARNFLNNTNAFDEMRVRNETNNLLISTGK